MEQKEYEEVLKVILNHPEFIKRKEFQHHENESVYDHCIKVSKLAYKIAKKLRLKNPEEVAIGALLHDFYDKPWQNNPEKVNFFKQHGFIHASQAAENAKKYFPDFMNHRIEDMIRKHMFPLNIKPPRYIGSWIVNISDDIISMNIFLHPRSLPKYIGIKNKKKRK